MVSLLQCWFCLVVERNLGLQAWEAGTLQFSYTPLQFEVLNKGSVLIQKGRGAQDSNPATLGIGYHRVVFEVTWTLNLGQMHSNARH